MGGLLAFLLAFPCALIIGSMYVIGHDACHHAFTSSRTLNHVIGRIAFLTSLHNFSLWDIGHNRTHHRYTNLRGKDYAWEPMSPGDFAAARIGARILYRFFRSPIGVPFYYTIDIWGRRMAFARPSVIHPVCRPALAHFADTLLVWLYAAGLAAKLASVAAAHGRGSGKTTGRGSVARCSRRSTSVYRS
ncbi:MAG TPA: fatty acid desaturase [Stellaceae bacterium]|jgi:omega-6 fatty acid desaturase (delta-12 desaturase)